MINRFANLTSRLAALFAIIFALAACGGGGGGGGGGSFLPDDGGDTPENGSYFVTLELTDANGNPTGTLSATQPANLTVTVTTRGSNKNPIEGAVVTAATDTATLVPANGSALTNIDGVALLQLLAGDTQGAGIVTVTVESPDGPTVEEIGFQVIQAGLQIGSFQNGTFVPGEIDLNLDELVAGGSARLRVAIVDENGNITDSTEQVRFSSSCSVSGQASFSSTGGAEMVSRLTVETSEGSAEATYQTEGCAGTDAITAELLSNGGTASASVAIMAPEAGFVGWITTNPINDNNSSLIALRGTGSANRTEKATVTFQVCTTTPTVDAPCDPISGANVNFSLSNSLGGIALQSTSGSTDTNGEVDAVVQSGNVSTSVFVTAEIDGGAGNTSNDIVVSTGLPDQNSISLSASVLNVDGALDFDGRTAELTVRLADKFNNPVADGTSAVFTTEYGSIDTSCVTVNGGCSVTWTSQNPRLPVFNQDLVRDIGDPDYDCLSHNGTFGACPDDLGPIRGLRTTILVTVVGEEYFVDSNGNGLYDEGEPFDNLPEAFVDHNEDGVYTPVEGPNCDSIFEESRCEAAGAEETFVDFNGDGKYSLNVDPSTGQGVYNGSLCPEEGDGVFCSRELVSTRDSIVLIMSADNDFDILVANARNNRATNTVMEGDPFVAYVADFYNNRPSGDTTIKVETEGCNLLTQPEFTVPGSNKPGAFELPIAVDGDGGGVGTLTITVDGVTTETFNCVTTAPVDPNDGGGLNNGN
ncbi:MAG: hypothetical protein ABJK20_16965 [Halieaceae bacterium]